MGWFSWLFGPTDPAERVAAARALVARKRYNDARLAVMDLAASRPDAREVAGLAAVGLCRLNLEVAIGYGNAGNEQKAAEHLELAASFHEQAVQHGAEVAVLDREMRAARGEVGGGLDARAAEASARRAERQPQEDPRNPFRRDDGVPDEHRMRIALIGEGYPPALRAGFADLGPVFANAVAALEDGQAEQALATLSALDDAAPLVWWERARAAHALRDLPAAVRAARQFAGVAGGHHVMAHGHSGEWLAARLAEQGRVDEALSEIRAIRAVSPKVGRFLHAGLLEATGALADADALLVSLQREMPNEMAIYAMLGRIRIAGGQRAEAVRALEAAMNQCACGTGKCGAPQPSLGVVRPLATLYLEDGLDTARGLELAAQARAMVQKPAWEDVYLAALATRGTPEGVEIATRLHGGTPAGDPRRQRLEQLIAG